MSNNEILIGACYNNIETQKYFWGIAGLFALMSAARCPFLPEFQLLILLFYTIKRKGIDKNVVLLLVTILCTHHYSIPDIVLREDGSSYPSIYTKAYGGIKILDLLIVFIVSISMPTFYRRNILKFFYIPGLPTILLISAFFGLLFLNNLTFSKDNFLFLSRSYLLFFVMFIQTIRFTKKDFYTLAWLIIFSWSIKMFFAILIPHSHPMFRSILGIDGIIFFTGDEYMTLPYFFVMLLCLSSSKKHLKYTYLAIYIVFSMTLISQRKGAIPIFLGLIYLIYCSSNNKRIGSALLKVYYSFFSLMLFLFLYNINKLTDDPLIRFAFYEYSEFSHIAIDSISKILHTNIFEFILGISPFGKYEIINLPEALDHLTSFGKEVGEKFRYQLWSFPQGRCILNVGLLGLLTVYTYVIKAFRYKLPYFYLTIICIPICYYENLTPVNAFAMGIVYAFMYNVSRNKKWNLSKIKSKQ